MADDTVPITLTTEQVEAFKDNTIDYESFSKVDIRIATIKDALIVEDADKLLVLALDIGEPQVRTVCAGLREHYNHADLVGKQVLYVANLAKRKLRGIESEGMILAATDAATNRVILTGPMYGPLDNPVTPGSKVK